MKITNFHAKYFAHELTKRVSSASVEKLSSSLSNAQVDLNPHQIEAALFAFRSPLSKGAILADEVGLGKTIEAGLVISQKWAERKRTMLLIVPSSLRKQWSSELQEKFFLPSVILEAKSFNQCIKDGNLNPLEQTDQVIICSYHFARSKAPYLKSVDWDLVVIDEAHRLRNVYKTGNKIARDIKNAVLHAPKILLTATPLQNSLLELYGLVSIIDEHVFGDLKTFKTNYARVSREQNTADVESGLVEPNLERFADLRSRLSQVCTRTLRRQVLEYIKYTNRIPLTQDYEATDDEVELYDKMSEYLQLPVLFALPSRQRHLMTLILRKLMASSTFAIASTLEVLIKKLDYLISIADKQLKITEVEALPGIEENFEQYDELVEEWIDDEEGDEDEDNAKKEQVFSDKDLILMKQEKLYLEKCSQLAKKIWKNSKGEALLTALEKGFEQQEEIAKDKTEKAPHKAIIFTESTVTQNYLLELLSKNGYADKIVLFNGSNTDVKSKEIYSAWIARHQDSDKVTGSKTADMRAALIDYFREEAEIMIATEAAAEGVNLQFCSLLINYDLPWNPQRIEQRIGRCHRYGQKHDVVVINFINRRNAADQRVYQLLDQKFNLFKGVFGASDEVLGNIESGVDFEKRIAAIYQSCRTEDDINKAFDNLQSEMDENIQDSLRDTRQKLLENFDSEVHERLKINLKESKAHLDTFEHWLWDITRFYLGEKGNFSKDEYSFSLNSNPFPGANIEEGPYKIGKNVADVHIYRPAHPLAERILAEVKKTNTDDAEVVFDYTNNDFKISILQSLVGKSGTMQVVNCTVSSFESEDHILFVGMDDNGQMIEPEVLKKMFALSGDVGVKAKLGPVDTYKLSVLNEQAVDLVVDDIVVRNNNFFDTEVDKLDKWADDVKQVIELDLRRLEIDIKTAKTSAKKILKLEDKVKIQREIKEMEKKRNEMRQQLYEAQDNVDRQKEDLIGGVEKRLHQSVEIVELFKIKWKVV